MKHELQLLLTYVMEVKVLKYSVDSCPVQKDSVLPGELEILFQSCCKEYSSQLQKKVFGFVPGQTLALRQIPWK